MVHGKIDGAIDGAIGVSGDSSDHDGSRAQRGAATLKSTADRLPGNDFHPQGAVVSSVRAE
jgi:hypothetical protein